MSLSSELVELIKALSGAGAGVTINVHHHAAGSNAVFKTGCIEFQGGFTPAQSATSAAPATKAADIPEVGRPKAPTRPAGEKTAAPAPVSGPTPAPKAASAPAATAAPVSGPTPAPKAAPAPAAPAANPTQTPAPDLTPAPDPVQAPAAAPAPAVAAAVSLAKQCLNVLNDDDDD